MDRKLRFYVALRQLAYVLLFPCNLFLWIEFLDTFLVDGDEVSWGQLGMDLIIVETVGDVDNNDHLLLQFTIRFIYQLKEWIKNG